MLLSFLIAFSIVSSLLIGGVILMKSKEYKDNIRLTSFQSEALHGLMIGDLHAERRKPTHNTRLSFDQSNIHLAYAEHLYQLFGSLINMDIYTTDREPDSRTGIIYVSLMFKTLTFAILNPFRELYYVGGVKIIPSNLGDFFTAVSFAY